MGWKFLETIGEKVAAAASADDTAMAEALAAKVKDSGLDIDDLEIEFAGGKATISGVAADDATIEKAVLIVGNTEGVGEVEADGFVAGTTEGERAEWAKAREEAIAKARARADAKDEAETRKQAMLDLRERRRKAQEAAKLAQSKFYEVKKGDTLSKIAKEFYGDGSKYPAIFEANKPMLKSADLIYPGQVLRIPALDA
ncbi:MAG: LysM peptidoglycan-binding domain-containing protein [Actinobacteria bacterium]|nr:LysM peptidoglycan-binding domain-containing protein [Actinomycetota bacterium]